MWKPWRTICLVFNRLPSVRTSTVEVADCLFIVPTDPGNSFVNTAAREELDEYELGPDNEAQAGREYQGDVDGEGAHLGVCVSLRFRVDCSVRTG